jgi:heme/copper-type cytochrome/quinol oxidase subunit 3
MSRPVLDVSALPTQAFGPRTTLWWGVVVMLTIETMALAMTAVGVVYVRQNFPAWPPYGTAPPNLIAATTNTALLLLSLIPMRVVESAARRFRRTATVVSLGLMTLLGVGHCVLRGFELAALNCRWDDHAYGSAAWLLVGMHAAHLLGATLENLLLAVVIARSAEPKHYVDADSNAFYWYFIVLSWLPIYVIVYLWPHWS